jgi:hypothetical protein
MCPHPARNAHLELVAVVDGRLAGNVDELRLQLGLDALELGVLLFKCLDLQVARQGRGVWESRSLGRSAWRCCI